MWQRTLTIYVDVSEAWLLPDEEQAFTDDNVVASDGWKEIQTDVRRALDGIYKNKDVPTFDLDWEDTPQKA